MNDIIKKFFLLVCIAGSAVIHADNASANISSPYFFTRSQSRNKVHQVVGSVGHTHLYDAGLWWGTSDALLVYERTFRPQQITRALFGVSSSSTVNPCCRIPNQNACPEVIKIQGSQVTNRDPNAWLADYFYLPVDFNSTISFKPRISNVLIVLDEYIGMDEVLCGLYFRIYGPITFTRWDLGLCEKIITRGVTGYPAGYFGPASEVASNLLSSFTDYAAGALPAAPNLRNSTIGAVNTNVLLQPLKYARLRTNSKKRTGFADLRMELGWDFLQSECYHLGVNIQGAAPTGNPLRAEYTFDPLVGNGKHWEIGGGVTGHYTFCMDETGDRSVGFYVDANITHLFKARQERTFDLKCKPVSRYMLAERLGFNCTSDASAVIICNIAASSTPGTGGTITDPLLQFKSEFAPVANLTTTDVKSSFAIQADVVAWFNCTFCNWSLDVGYNFWGTSREKMRLDCNCSHFNFLCDPSQTNGWALKGDARVFGFASDTDQPFALSATESAATITTGTNVSANNPGSTDFYKDNYGVDNPAFALTAAGVVLTTVPGGAAQIKTSLQAVPLTCNDIDFTRHQGLSHKVFGHLSYTFACDCVLPYLGVGGSAEFAQHRTRKFTCATDTNCGNKLQGSSLRWSPSLWSVWVKGGVSFD